MSLFTALSTDLKREISYFLPDTDLTKLNENFLQDEDDVFWKMRLNYTYNLSSKKSCEAIERILSKCNSESVIIFGLVEQYMMSQEWSGSIIYYTLSTSYKSYLPEYLNARDKNFKTMLMFLVTQIRSTTTAKYQVQDLIQAGVDVNLQDKNGSTALMMAVHNSNTSSSEEVVKMLIDAGADVNIQNKNGLTALMIAANYSNSKSTNATVKMLIDAGADLNLQEYTIGWTALAYAARYSDTDSNNETVKMLINAGADVNKVFEKNGNIVVMNVVYNTKIGSNNETVKLLLDAGSNINHINRHGFNIITLVCTGIGNGSSSESTLDLVLTYKPDVNIIHPSGKTNLMCCLDEGLNCSNIIKLIQAGADVNTFSNNMTPLMYAIQTSTADDIIKLLTHPNIDVSIKNSNGDTAYDLSVKKYGQNHPITKMLKAYQ
jgi:ankyrin repeat protein